MRMTRLVPTLLITLLLAVSSLANAGEVQKFAAHRLLVQPVPSTSAAQFEHVLAQHSAKTISVIPQINVHVVELPAQADERAMAALLAHDPHVKFAEPDVYVPPQMTANDPYYGSEWHLSKIQAPQAWDSSLGDGVTVAIVDTGVDAAQPDLAGKLLTGWDVVSNSADTSDINGHGTAVAGTVGAASNNSQGVASLAWNAMLLPVRVSDASNGYAYYSDIASGLIWAADHGARVANVSFDVSGSSTVQSAAQYMRSKNGNVVVSAGNSGAYSATAASNAFLSVSATDSNDNVTSWSTYGTFVDLSAPGVGIISTNKAGGYNSWSGTSFSSPIVAGVAALVIAANPALSPAQVDNILISTSDDLGSAGYDMYYGAGRVNAARAVQAALNAQASDFQAPSVSITSPGTGSTVNGQTTVSVAASDNVSVSKVELFINGSLWATATSAPYNFTWDTSLTANGTATLQAYAWDAAGNQGQSQADGVTVSNLTADIQAPSVSITSPSTGSTVSGQTTVSVAASDNVSVSKVELFINGSLWATATSAPYDFTWDTSLTANGTATLQAYAWDSAGNQTQSQTDGVTVSNFTAMADTQAPTVTFLSPTNDSSIGNKVNIVLSADDNVGVTMLSLAIDGNTVSVSKNGQLRYHWNCRNVAAGVHTLTATAQDAAGNRTVTSISVIR